MTEQTSTPAPVLDLQPKRAGKARPARALVQGSSWRAPSARVVTAIKVVVFLVCLIPFGRLLFFAGTGGLGANPIEFITRATGYWTLFLLCMTLLVTPLRTWTKMPWLLKLRRMLGLFAFFYVALHFTTYLWFDQNFDLASIGRDILKRPFILVGFMAFVLLIPLAATSFNKAVKWLGGKRWQLLHRLVYPIALLGLLHFYWMRSGKQLYAQPNVFAAVLAILLGWRIWAALKKRRA